MRSDFSLANDLAAKNPKKLAQMQALFLKEAGKYGVLPMDDRVFERLDPKAVGRPDLMAGRTSLTLAEGMTGMMEGVFVNVKNRSKTITAEIEVPEDGGNGTVDRAGRPLRRLVAVRQGRRAGLRLQLPRPAADSIAGAAKLPPGKATLQFDFDYDGGGPAKGGKGTLLVNGEKVAEGRIEQTQAGLFSADETADVGIDLGTPVVEAIGAEAKSRFTGRIPKLTVEVKYEPLKKLSIVAAALLAAMATVAAAAQQYKQTTPVPPGIAAPNEMQTRFGTLKFFDGVPDQASTQKIYDNLDFQRAVQGYLLGLPAVNQLANRTNILKMGPANTTVPIWEDLVDSRTIELTANNNTPYTWFWLDLRNGPLVLEVPPKVLGPDRRHVVPVEHGPRHHRPRQGRRRQVPAAAARLQGPGAGRLPRRSQPHVPDLGRLAQLPGGRRSQAGRGRGEAAHQDLPARAGRQPAAGADLRQHVRQAVQHGRAGRRVVLADAAPGRAGGADRHASTPPRSASGPRSASRRASPSRRTRA